MDRVNSTQRRPEIILAICIVVISVFAIVTGSIPVTGFLWNVDKIDNISVGNDENQTIRGIKVYSEDDPVKIRVGSVVDSGAKFDDDRTSYRIKNGQTARDSEVFIKNPNTTDATLVINSSALNSTTSFDVEIENIDTTNMSKFNKKGQEINKEFEYITTQAGESDHSTFSVQTSANVSINTKNYNDSSSMISFDNLSLVNNSTDQIVVWEKSSEGDLSKRIATFQGGRESISIDNNSIKGEEEIAVTVQPESTNSTEVIYAVDHATIEAPITTELLQEPIYYPENDRLDRQYSESIYFKFNTNIRHDRGDIYVNYFDGTTHRVPVQNKSNNVTVLDEDLYISLNSTSNTQNYIQNVTVDGLVSEYGGEELSQGVSEINRAGDFISSRTNTTVSQGTKVAVTSNESETIQIFSENRSINPSEIEDNNHNKIIHTSDIPTGEYKIESESETNASRINITEATLSPKIPTANKSTGILINFESSALDRQIMVRVQNENNTSISEKVVEIKQHKTENQSIMINEWGEYFIEFRDIRSGDTIRRSVDILKNRDSDLIFDSDQNGSDVGTKHVLELNSSYNRSRLELINKSSRVTLATANLSTPSSGRTSIGLNTYAFGNESLTDSLVTAGPGATVESVDTSVSNGTLPPGEYRIEVRSAQGLAETSDEATVTVGNRSTSGLNAYATTTLDRDALGTAGAVRRAIEDGTLSPTSTVTADDTVVYAVNATGLTGLPAARNATTESGADLARLDGLAFGVRSNASTLSAATGDDRTGAVGAAPKNSSVHIDDEGLYLIAEGDDALATDETPAGGEDFTAEFRVTDERLREAASDSASDHSASTTLTFEVPPPDEADGDSEGGDSLGGGGSAGGGSAGGPEGGGPVGEPTGGGTSGGGPSTDGGGTTGGGPTGSPPETGTSPRGGKTETPGDATGTGPRPDLRVSGGQFGVRPLADVRPIARENHTGSPASVSRTSVPVDTGAAPSGGEIARSETGADRGGAGTTGADAGSDEAAGTDGVSGTDEAAGTNAGDSRSRGGSDSTAKSDAADAEPQTPTYDDAPIRTTADDVPGFGPLVTVVAFLLAGRLAARRRGREP
ncbi:PGF-CTERM sorting domain-containing protein [Halorubrum sp. Eb13]|uniref:PGF-CTERM sorting domain-containing protein n=1 Tax=Halorubrum sp. Eb13 TaxID=1383843 RepID=UPI0020CFD21E|nr:PGF-CTERM sorting domain-containing protein [Halorubrum sp. Eb13]